MEIVNEKIKKAAEADKELKMIDAKENQAQRDHELLMKEMDVDVKIYDIDQRTAVALATANNEEPQLIDDNSTDLVDLSLKEKAISETIRHNKVTETETRRNNISKDRIAKIKKKQSTSTK